MNKKVQKRPVGLIVLSILTIINAGLLFISNLTALFVNPDINTLKKSNAPLIEQAEYYRKLGATDASNLLMKITRMNELFFQSYYSYHFAMTLIAFIGILGTLLMLRKYILGFHIYIVYSIMSVAHLYMFVNPKEIPTSYIIVISVISLIFIWIYSKYRFWMTIDSFSK